MLEQDKRDFTTMINAVRELYGQPAATPAFLKMYFAALSRFTLQDVKAAMNSHVQNTDSGQFFPKPADIIRELHGNSQTQAGAAWTKVDKAIRGVGPYQSVVFDDPIIHTVLDDMGGWIQLCSVDSKEYPFKQNEFEKRYRGYANRPPEQYLRKLTGICEAENSRKGLKSEGPILIGNEQQAALVYQGGDDTARRLFHSASDVLERLEARMGKKTELLEKAS